MIKAADGKLLRKSRILVAPLDWGLGHATRCIPVVKELLANACEVWLAGEGSQEALLRSEFPELHFLPLRGYRVKYSRSGTTLSWKIVRQIPKIISAITQEHAWLKKMMASLKFDAIISDNRFGLYHSAVPSVFITHQLNIKTRWGKWSEHIMRRWNYKYINRFTECWVPDVAEENNLAGQLSHPAITPKIAIKYVGPLSRFGGDDGGSMTQAHDIKKDHLLFILSGPEPQRSIFENKVVNEVSHYEGTSVIVRGLPSSLSVIPSTGMIKFYNHLPADELNEEVRKADWVISRCGYSTVMDLVALGKKSVLIPTPGQTEQEYLAQHLQKKQIAFSVDEANFSLDTVLKDAQNFNYRPINAVIQSRLKEAVQTLLQSISR